MLHRKDVRASVAALETATATGEAEAILLDLRLALSVWGDDIRDSASTLVRRADAILRYLGLPTRLSPRAARR